MLRALVMICVTMFAVASRSDAQDTLRIDLDEAIRIAVANNPAIVRATNQQRTADARVRLADAALDPDLRLTAGPSVRYAPGADGSGDSRNGSDEPLSTSFSVGATSTLLVIDGSARSYERARARFELEHAQLSRHRTTQDVVLLVTSAAIDAAVARELIAVERENLLAERRQFERVDAFVDAGSRPVAERFVQDAAVAAAELRVLTAERNLSAATIALALTLGMDPTRPIVVSNLGPTSITAQDSSVVADMSRALGGRTDLLASRSRIEASRQNVLAADAGNALSVGVTGGIGTNYGSASTGAFGDQFARTNPAASLGLTVTLPLFDRVRTDAAAELARIEAETAELELSKLERDVTAQIELARLDYRTAVARLTVSERQLEAARQALDADEARYTSGSSTLAELAQTRARYISAASQRVQAGYEILERRANLEYAIGTTPTGE